MIENGEYFFWTYRGDVYGSTIMLYSRQNSEYYSISSDDTGYFNDLWGELTQPWPYRTKKVII